MTADKNIEKEVGLPEIAVGVATAAGVTAGMSSMLGKQPERIITSSALYAKIQESICKNGAELCKNILGEFNRSNPAPSNDKALKIWAVKGKNHLANSPAYQAFAKAEAQRISGEEFAKARDLFKTLGKTLTVDDFFKGTHASQTSTWEKPLLAFKSLSTGGKIGVGAVALASAVGMGYVVNKWRNGKGTHIERLEQERSEPKFRTLSDI